MQSRGKEDVVGRCQAYGINLKLPSFQAVTHRVEQEHSEILQMTIKSDGASIVYHT